MKALRCDLEKSVLNIGFLGAVLITALLCFTANVYTDMLNDKSYSVFEVLFSLDRQIIADEPRLSSIFVFKSGLSGYITMFIPIIVAFPFMVSFCAERNNGLMRFTITRSGKYRYYFAKFFSSFLSGGAAVLLGVAVFGVFAAAAFPNISSYQLDAEELGFYLPDSVPVTVIKTLVSAFLYGAVSTLPAFFLSSFCKNPYIITCLPFMLTYVWSTSISKAITKGFENGDWEISEKLYPFTPDAISSILSYEKFTAPAIKTVVFNCAYAVIMLAGFIIIMNKRTDKGV